ncbi:hypothetical protein B0H15DRAFT_840812 [Mycena belliarum]|uniref:MYND-type domain-containing protein n=1 Tax=Mycena belliarum TaxID=1033014 RepID=A0AAD6XR12_9AGAR|nr:hypothetical protein B0H15DRAFT_840812 [Mycena belliae]
MHSSLQLRSLSKLPLTLRKRANAAIGGSATDLRLFCKLMSGGPSTNHVLLLPVLYEILSPAAVPDLVAQLDSPERAPAGAETELMHVTRIIQALATLQQLSSSDVLSGPALADFWPRCWLWVHFLDLHRESLTSPWVDLDEYASFCVSVIITLRISASGHISELIDATPGVRTILVRGWPVVLQKEDVLHSWTFYGLCSFLAGALDANVEQNLDEAIEGVGSREALATLVVTHMNRVVSEPSDEDKADFLTAVCPLIALNLCPDVSFQMELILGGVVAAVTSAARLLSRAPRTDNPLLPALLHLLRAYFKCEPGHRWIAQSLGAGLLDLLVACGQPPYPAHLVPERVLGEIVDLVSQSLVHRSVLEQLRTSLAELDHHDQETRDAFPERGIISNRWQALMALAPTRIRILEDLEDSMLRPQRACDNLECDVVDVKTRFRRCSDCLTSNYCSRECQVRDWEADGGHREICQQLGSVREKRTYLNARGRSFFRTLLHHDYLAVRPRLLLQLVAFFRSTPGKMPYILFDYTDYTDAELPCTVTIRPANELGPEFSSYISRAEKSGGRLQLHAMKVQTGYDEQPFWMFPLRSATAEITNELKGMAMEPLESSQNKRMDTLIALDVLEIH